MSNTNFNPSYVGERQDIERLLDSNPKRVLDVGCSAGALGAAIKARTGAQVFGIEYSPEMASVAATRLNKVFVGDATAILSGKELRDQKFDTIIFADLLEHLADPWSALISAVERLEPGGTIIASIPNIRHIDTLYNLVVKGYWPYRTRGIHDQTHLRFFTKKNIIELFDRAGLSIVTMEANYRLIEKPHRFNRFAKWFALPGVRNFLAFQYLVKGQRK